MRATLTYGAGDVRVEQVPDAAISLPDVLCTDLARDFGATDVVPERGAEGIARVRELAVVTAADRCRAARRTPQSTWREDRP